MTKSCDLARPEWGQFATRRLLSKDLQRLLRVPLTVPFGLVLEFTVTLVCESRCED
jgi:hypothetical protein